jgi:hypothetical protein
MLEQGKLVREKEVLINQKSDYRKGEDETKPGHVPSYRRWFGA